MLRDKLSKLGYRGFAVTSGSDSIAATEVGSLSVPVCGGIGS